MKYLCPICGHTLATEDLNIYTCINCDEIFTIDELEEEYGLTSSCSNCQTD
ncbi:hypothetical protein KHQ81_13485 [Mycoplasmatota bacterium]|nr:hypothetical protein KHQ81_13485 [Mycoplasmatota bacterium]